MTAATQFLDSLARALGAPDPLLATRSLAAAELGKGTERESLVGWFEEARERFPDQEDLLLDVMDFIVGWCSPHMKLAEPAADDRAPAPTPAPLPVGTDRPLDAGKAE